MKFRNFTFSINFSLIFHQFVSHISWPVRVFPWPNRAHIKYALSSNIVLKRLLRISWSVKYFCQKYWVKGSKSCNSAGTPRISRRPVQWWRWGRVLRTIYLKIIDFCVKMLFFWSWNAFRLISGHLQKIVKFSNFRQNFDIFCDTFPDHFESSRGPIELILSKLQALT